MLLPDCIKVVLENGKESPPELLYWKSTNTPLYGEMGYIGSTCQFHTFSADGFSYGLSFADVTDAQNFYNYVIGFLTSRPLISPYSSTEPLAKSGRIKAAKFGQILNKGKTLFKRKNDKESDAVIVVNDFKHTKHVGFSENSEFQIFAENEELANELIEALHLKINNKKEMQDVMNVIDRFGADQLQDRRLRFNNIHLLGPWQSGKLNLLRSARITLAVPLQMIFRRGSH
ncbi:hypothetical protein ACTXT7_000193 [Hymenolepis weldensis]